MKSFAVFVFYLIGILPILWELSSLMKLSKRFNFLKELKQNKDYKEWSSNQKAVGFLMLGYIIWAMVGLFSSQWIIFFFILLVSLIPKKWLWFFAIDAFVTVILLFFLIINQYHLHINIWELIKSFL
jgi:hypothetical protein